MGPVNIPLLVNTSPVLTAPELNKLDAMIFAAVTGPVDKPELVTRPVDTLLAVIAPDAKISMAVMGPVDNDADVKSDDNFKEVPDMTVAITGPVFIEALVIGPVDNDDDVTSPLEEMPPDDNTCALSDTAVTSPSTLEAAVIASAVILPEKSADAPVNETV